MKKQTLIFAALLILGWSVFEACKHEIPGGLPVIDPVGGGVQTPVNSSPGVSGRSCSADTVYFANAIMPLLNASCAMAGCHDAISHAEGLNLTSYSGIMRIVSAGSANGSKLYSVINTTGSNRMPPPPKLAMTAAQKSTIQKWINQGAKNNVCDACDTSNFKYSTAIQPLIQNKCVGCHNSASLGGGIDLSSYAAVKVVALNGKLFGSVNWSAGFSAMPKGSAKSPDCEIQQIKKWVDAGSPNN